MPVDLVLQHDGQFGHIPVDLASVMVKSAIGPVPTPQDNLALISRLQEILGDSGLYRQLLKSRGSVAQRLLDSFQQILDTPQIKLKLRRSLIVATQRLSTASGLYPACYELKDLIQISQHPVACGGFSDIYKGELRAKPVCIKAVRIYQNSEIKLFLKQFSKEAVLWRQLSHSNILPIYGLYRFQNRVCFVSPWMEAGNISNYLKRNPGVDRSRLASGIAQGLLYLHTNGIIHGDLKGPNVLVDDAGNARLADFGLSSVSDSKIPTWQSYSSAASKGRSVRWQAPELFDFMTDTIVKNSTKTDVYALSCVYYEIFTGEVPFAHVTIDSAVALRVMSGARPSRPADSSSCWRQWGLTEAIWKLMEDCWVKTPQKRPDVAQIVLRLVSGNFRTGTSVDLLALTTPHDRVTPPSDTMTVIELDDILRVHSVNGSSQRPDKSSAGKRLSGDASPSQSIALNSRPPPRPMNGTSIPQMTMNPQGMSKFRGEITAEGFRLSLEHVKPMQETDNPFRWVRGQLICRGTNGRGHVYLALDTTTAQVMLVKQIKKLRSERLQPSRHFKQKMKTFVDLNHPNLMRYIGWEESEGFLNIFMQYVPGGSISDCLLKYGTFDENVTKSFTAQILGGLEYLHSRKITHHALKPSNILVGQRGQCQISDIQVWRRSDKTSERETKVSPMVAENIFWMAPEAILASRSVYHPKMNIWSTGCIVLQMWSGEQRPFPSEVHLSPLARDFRAQCLNANPDERPTATELLKHAYLVQPPEWRFEGIVTWASRDVM